MSDSRDPIPPPTTDTARLAADVALHLERWYEQRDLRLPPEAQAGFARMGVEAVLAHPERPRDEVLDELVAELDQRLDRIRAEPEPEPDTPGGEGEGEGEGEGAPAPPAEPRGFLTRLRRLFRR